MLLATPNRCGLCGCEWWACGETMCPQPKEPKHIIPLADWNMHWTPEYRAYRERLEANRLIAHIDINALDPDKQMMKLYGGRGFHRLKTIEDECYAQCEHVKQEDGQL